MSSSLQTDPPNWRLLMLCTSLLWLAAGCARASRTESGEARPPPAPTRLWSRVVLTYNLRDDCPNWNKALAVASRKMGCGTKDPRPTKRCREKLACDVCQFLREG